MEAHNAELKTISEGVGSILIVQKRMEKELAGLRQIKTEWPVFIKTLKEMRKELTYTRNKVEDLDKKVAAVLPNHEKRLTHLEAKPV